MTNRAVRSCRTVLLVLLSLFAVLVGAGAPVAASATYDFDTTCENVREGCDENLARPPVLLLAGIQEQPASLLSAARGAPTTVGSSFVAPNRTPELPNPSTINNAAAPIRSFVTQTDTVYCRVYSDRAAGGFLTSAPPRSSADAISSLALPSGNRATFVQEVAVPAGTRLQSSVAAEAFGQSGGALQFELLDRIPIDSFGPGRPLG